MGVAFVVAEVYDLSSRAGLLCVGRLESGEISAGDVLRVSRTQASVRVMAVEFQSPAQRIGNTVTLVLERVAQLSLERDDLLEA